jgi:hypothetical protein
MSPARLSALALIVLVSAACSTPRTGEAVNNELESAMGYFETRINQNEPLEAFYMYKAIQTVDPAYPGLEDTAQAFRDAHMDLVDYFSRDWIGSNFSLRMPTDLAIGPEHEESGTGSKIAWYLPDRILDIFDMVSFDVHFGFGAYVDAHATRILKVDAGFRTVAGVGWHDHRSLGLLNQADATIGLFPLGTRGFTATQAGTSGVQSGSWSVAGTHRPSDELYTDFVDYWAVGASATAAIVGVSADFHPVEAFDMLVGWFLFDPGNDDFGRTRGNRLHDSERATMTTLGKIARNDEEMVNYANFKAGNNF